MPQAKKHPKVFCENFSSNSDLRLSGSQMNLSARPRSTVAKASARALTVGGVPRNRRPMSAVPHSEFPGGPRNKRRPYSADGQFLVSNRPTRRDKNSTNFPRSQEDSFLDHSESEKDNYQISSSTLLNSLMSDDATSGPWTDIHAMPLTSRPVDLDTNESLTNTSDLLCTFSDISEEPTNSEKSLGERICEMAQNSACEIDLSASIPPRNIAETDITKSAEADLEEEDTRNLSNRELHFRMIAAGLISRPGSKNVQADCPQNDDVIKEEDCNVSVATEEGTNETGEKGKDENLGESGTENSKFGRRTVTFGEENIDKNEEEGGAGEEEPIRPKVPVRFQQWVTTNSPSSPAKTELTTLFCSTQLYPFRRRKSDLFLECMVEEILDEEQEKLLGTENPWTKPSEFAKNKEEKLEKDVSISTWPAMAEESANDVSKKRVEPIEKKNEKTADDLFSVNRDGCETWNPESVENPQSKNGNDKTSISSTTTVQINKSTIPTPCHLRKNSIESSSADIAGPSSKKTAPGKSVRNSAPISGRRTTVIPSTKVCSTVAVATCRLGRAAKPRFSPLRRNCKDPSLDEDRLPGEYTSEVESWMSVKCGDDVIKTRGIEIQTTKTTVEGIQGDSTFDEIFDLLKVLEEDEKSTSSILPTCTNKPAGAGDATLSVVSDSLQEGQHSDQNVGAKKAHVSSKDHDMKNILSYLDLVNESCDSALTSERVSPSGTVRTGSYCRGINSSENSERIDELLVMSHVDLAREVLSVRLSLEESSKTIELLRTSLKEQREAQIRREKTHKSALDKKLHEVKSECEAILKRHQKFIDQLIADKAALSERCERLVNDSRQAEERHAKTITEMEERHKIEIQRTKDIATATEKLRHERWVDKKTQKIKELTVRGLEPELNRMSTQHEQQLSSLRTLHAQELEQAELRAARRCSQQLDALRHQMQKEQEEALTREREQQRQRLEKIQQAEDDKLEEQRRLLVAEIRRERDRLAAHEVALEAQFEERKRVLEKDTERERERLRREYIEKAEVLQNANQIEMNRLRESLETEKEAWLTANKQQQAQAVAQATTEVKEQLRRERDRELEAVIERLESEVTQARLEKEHATENRIRRLRDQYNNELQEAERELASHQAKNSDLRASLQEKEAALVALEVQNRSLLTELQETRKIAEQFSAERADIKKAIHKEIENDMEKLRAEIAEVRAKHIRETTMLSEQMERERNVHQQELQNLYTRVRQAIEKKDDIVQTAKAKHRAAEDHIKHLEAMLQHQRRIHNHALP